LGKTEAEAGWIAVFPVQKALTQSEREHGMSAVERDIFGTAIEGRMRFRIPEIFLGVFLTVAIFSMGMLFSSSVFPPNEKPETGAQDHSKQEASKATTDEKIADYTWWLAVLTGGLVFVAVGQRVFIARSDKTARIAADAADLCARAAIALQLPIIRVVPGSSLGHGESISGQDRIEDCYIYSVDVCNLGDTKAFPKEVLFGWTVGETLPDAPKYRFVARFPHNCILKPNQIGLIQPLTGSLILKEGEWEKICGGNYLWFYCAVLYEDFMGETRSEGFCWCWSYTGIGLGWRVEKAAAYNKKNAALSQPTSR
jgi:hypothetical protein